MPATVVLVACLVVGIVDGDTIDARCGDPGSYEQVRVRIAAIDAPEKKQAFGERSRQHLSEICFRAEATITQTAKDRYGRTVADVRCAGKDVATAQVRAGMAWVYDKYSKGYEQLYPIQDAARARRAGLWADAEPVAPWEWRKTGNRTH